jgi:uncharacterized protein (TIGR00725 family)
MMVAELVHTRLADALVIAVIGGADASATARSDAYETGAILAEAGAIVLTGGLGGVMEQACRGAKEHVSRPVEN